jgi:hypothetical protein
MDPRVTTSITDLQAQHDYSMLCYQNSLKAANYNDPSYNSIIGEYKRLMHILQSADMTPTEQVIKAVNRVTDNFLENEKSKKK